MREIAILRRSVPRSVFAAMSLSAFILKISNCEFRISNFVWTELGSFLHCSAILTDKRNSQFDIRHSKFFPACVAEQQKHLTVNQADIVLRGCESYRMHQNIADCQLPRFSSIFTFPTECLSKLRQCRFHANWQSAIVNWQCQEG